MSNPVKRSCSPNNFNSKVNHIGILKIGNLIFITDKGILNCSTINGTNPDALCIFPFKHNGVTYRQCTIDGNAEGDITPWCSTLVDDSGVHVGEAGNRGICGPDCLVDLTSE